MRFLGPSMMFLGAAAIAGSASSPSPKTARRAGPTQVFNEHCMPCHNATNQAGGLDLTQGLDALAATKDVRRGQPEQSRLYEYISGDARLMPRSGPPLVDSEIQTVKDWITSTKPDAAAIFAARCMPCHGADNRKGGLDLSQSIDKIGSVPEIKAGDPDNSMLFKRVAGTEGRQMPPSGPIPDGEIATLKAWIGTLKPDPSAIFLARCLPCHSSSRHAGNLDLSQSLDQIAMSTDVKAGDPINSTLVQRLQGNGGSPMPKGRSPLTAAEIQVVQDWVSKLPTN